MPGSNIIPKQFELKNLQEDNHQPRLYEPRLLTVGNRVLPELAGETLVGLMLGKELSSALLSPLS